MGNEVRPGSLDGEGDDLDGDEKREGEEGAKVVGCGRGSSGIGGMDERSLSRVNGDGRCVEGWFKV